MYEKQVLVWVVVVVVIDVVVDPDLKFGQNQAGDRWDIAVVVFIIDVVVVDLSLELCQNWKIIKRWDLVDIVVFIVVDFIVVVVVDPKNLHK